MRFAGPLLEGIPESDTASPLAPMTPEERLVADFRGAGLTVGPHPMAYRRAALRRARVLSAKELTQVVHGRYVRTAGCVIARQRPGTAKGFVFLSLEDETGISNAIISPDVMEQNRILIQSEKFLLLEGVLQNQEGVISVKVDRLAPMREAYASRDGGCHRRGRAVARFSLDDAFRHIRPSHALASIQPFRSEISRYTESTCLNVAKFENISYRLTPSHTLQDRLYLDYNGCSAGVTECEPKPASPVLLSKDSAACECTQGIFGKVLLYDNTRRFVTA